LSVIYSREVITFLYFEDLEKKYFFEFLTK